jgi:hypothetical protein
MDYREESFKRKFNAAAQHLSAPADQIVSLKLRETVSSYSDYRELVEMLQHEAGIHYSEVDGDLQGRGYLLSHEKTKLLLVEHETGLEILYIAGSIASLVGLVPLILQGWAAIRRQFSPRHVPNDGPVEIRRIDRTGHLQEEHLHPRQLSGSLLHIGAFAPTVSITATIIENDMRSLVQEVEQLGRRVDAIEEDAKPKGPAIPSKVSKSKVGQSKNKTSRKQSQKKS